MEVEIQPTGRERHQVSIVHEEICLCYSIPYLQLNFDREFKDTTKG